MKQFVNILLYLQFFVYNVCFTFDVNILTRTDASGIKWFKNGWKCNNNDDCTVMNTICVDRLCQCASGYVLSADMTTCLKIVTEYYDVCEETVQCSAYLSNGARCENVNGIEDNEPKSTENESGTQKRCVCGPGYYYMHGRCNRYVGLFEECKQDIDCYVNADFEASTCEKISAERKVCNCTSGFYQREYRTCRRKAESVGDKCVIDIDCSFANATCNDNFECEKDETRNKTAYIQNYDIELFVNDDENKQIWAGGICVSNEDCSDLGNAICDPFGTCRCERAYFASNMSIKCVPELGEPCKTDENPHIQYSICRKRWTCMDGFVALKNNRKCLNVTREYEGECQHDEQCYIFGPDAVCSNNKCVCDERISHYVESELFCWRNKGVHETCESKYDCHVNDFKGQLICNTTCDCLEGTKINRNKTICISDPAGIGEFCEEDDNCKLTPNSVCMNDKCSCDTNDYELEGRCEKGINATCETDKDCTVRNSLCTAEVCSCESDHVATTVDSCMPILSFGEPCSVDIQCSTNVTGAICATTSEQNDAGNKVCACSEGDYYSYEQCRKKRFLGETCKNLGECYQNSDDERIVCRNGKCSCDWGYVKHKDPNSVRNICAKNDETSGQNINGSVTNVVSTGLLSVIFFVFFL